MVRLGRVAPGWPGFVPGFAPGSSWGCPGFVLVAEALWRGRVKPSAHSHSKTKFKSKSFVSLHHWGGLSILVTLKASAAAPRLLLSLPCSGSSSPACRLLLHSVPERDLPRTPAEDVTQVLNTCWCPAYTPSPAPAIFQDESWTPSFDTQTGTGDVLFGTVVSRWLGTFFSHIRFCWMYNWKSKI